MSQNNHKLALEVEKVGGDAEAALSKSDDQSAAPAGLTEEHIVEELMVTGTVNRSHNSTQDDLADSILKKRAKYKRVASDGVITRATAQTFANTMGLAVTCKELGYIVKHRKTGDDLALLNNVNVLFQKEEVTALMGASGAGKTTLLDVISKRKSTGRIEGEVLFDGSPLLKKDLIQLSAYVEQFDNLNPTLTVKENIMYHSELKCAQGETQHEREKRIQRVNWMITDLALDKCKDNVVGGSLDRTISGGQAKRTNIGMGLVTEPRLIFLDEPTSGLDSATSTEVMAIVRRIGDGGATCISTIHSPTPQAFQFFDKVMVLSAGKMAYSGEVYGSNGVVPYFGAAGYNYDPLDNLADFLIEVTSQKDVDWAQLYSDSERRKENEAALEKYLAGIERVEPKKKVISFTNPIFAIKVLLKWRTTANYRSPAFVLARIGDKIIFGLVMMALYWDQASSESTAADQLNTSALLFMAASLPTFGAAGYMPSIVMERPLFYRERDDGCYTVPSYLIYKVIEEGLLASGASLIGTIMIYFGTSLDGNYGLFFLAYYQILLCGIALAYQVASVAPTMDAANTLLPVYSVTALFFTGILLRRQDIPEAFRWYSWTVFGRYGWQMMMLNHFGSDPEPPLFEDGDELLNIIEYYDVAGTIGFNYGLMVAIWIIWLLLASVGLTFIRHTNR